MITVEEMRVKVAKIEQLKRRLESNEGKAEGYWANAYTAADEGDLLALETATDNLWGINRLKRYLQSELDKLGYEGRESSRATLGGEECQAKTRGNSVTTRSHIVTRSPNPHSS